MDRIGVLRYTYTLSYSEFTNLFDGQVVQP